MKQINAVWASFVKLFAWRRLTAAEVVEIASWRNRDGDEWVEVTWVNSRGRTSRCKVPRSRIRVSDAIDSLTMIETRWGSIRFTVTFEGFREQIQAWDKLSQRRSAAS